jgi:hypothetical protein
MDKIIINVARSMPSVVTFKQNRPIILYFNTEILFYIIFRQGKWFYFLHITTFGQNMKEIKRQPQSKLIKLAGVPSVGA